LVLTKDKVTRCWGITLETKRLWVWLPVRHCCITSFSHLCDSV